MRNWQLSSLFSFMLVAGHASAAALLPRQDAGGTCESGCLLSASRANGCSIEGNNINYNCLCGDEGYLIDVAQCLADNCTWEEAERARTQGEQACAGTGRTQPAVSEASAILSSKSAIANGGADAEATATDEASSESASQTPSDDQDEAAEDDDDSSSAFHVTPWIGLALGAWPLFIAQ